MRIKKVQGQIAIFVVLIFQVLFILFAMTINIALVVHDKINFQNSIDLAVYYGAKQQTEVLNAMAHINYQMRQNWKLLAWRYRILGTLTQDQGGRDSAFWCPQNREGNNMRSCKTSEADDNVEVELCRQAQSQLPYGNDYCDGDYFLCISQDSWKRGIGQNNQNLCETQNFTIRPIQTIPMVAPFMIEYHLATAATYDLQERLRDACLIEGALNALMVQFFLTHFRLDQKDRKTMMKEIYNKSLKEGRDLDGNLIFEGVRKVFRNNLTSGNRKNLEGFRYDGLEEYNPFYLKPFEEIFQPLNVLPLLQYLDFEDSNDCKDQLKSNINFDFSEVRKQLNTYSHVLAGHLGETQRAFFDLNSRSLGSSIDPKAEPIAELTLGFYKKKDKILYYALKGEFDYHSRNQIFSLNINELKFKASAFAKAFGGRFGPAPEQSDPFIPVNHPSAPVPIPRQSDDKVNLVSTLLQPNYSRWPGDKWGLIDKRLHDDNLTPYSAFLAKQSGNDQAKGIYSMESFFHLIFYEGTADDPLARPRVNDQFTPKHFLRMMEMMAVYPDIYDISHYSVLGNYMQTYFPRICNLLLERDCDPAGRNDFARVGSKRNRAYIRGDFGWPENNYYIQKNHEKKGVELSIAPHFLQGRGYDINTNDEIWFERNPHTLFFKGKSFYPWLVQKLPDHLLSSWVPPVPLDYAAYTMSNAPFLKCNEGGRAKQRMPVPSACAVGGRSGYSVKLISCDMVDSFEDKPSNMREYCPP